MITENRWKHILGVARKAKEFALKMRPKDKKYVEDMFLLGLLHDIGYEFTEGNASHAIIGGEILKRSGISIGGKLPNMAMKRLQICQMNYLFYTRPI